MTNRHQHVLLLFDFKHELFLHATILPQNICCGKPTEHYSVKYLYEPSRLADRCGLKHYTPRAHVIGH
jgi:hypothetical protein